MLVAKRTGGLRSWDYAVLHGETRVAELPGSLLERAGSVEIGGRALSFGRRVGRPGAASRARSRSSNGTRA